MKYNLKLLLCTLLSLLISKSIFAQFVFEKKSDRTAFAEMYLGVDLLSSGKIQSSDRQLRSFDSAIPRFKIGATHFWGWVDFYVDFPLSRFELDLDDSETLSKVSYYNGVETGARLYLLPLKDGRLSPFVGKSWNAMRYQEEYRNGLFGADQSIYKFPVQYGLSYTFYPFIFELGATKLEQNKIQYATSASGDTSEVILPSSVYWASLKGSFETTKGVSKGSANNWGSPYFGVGPSSAWNLENGSYEKNEKPHLDYTKSTGKMAEISAGFEFEATGTLLNYSFRKITYLEKGFDHEVQYSRKSGAIEVMQIFADFHGFQPFIGLSYSNEDLKLQDTFPDGSTETTTTQKWIEGLVYGWDIRPVDYSWWYLRTTLRYYPKISIDLPSGNEARFVNHEFNFIQFVFLPGYL